jgi:hypothetical protein
VISNTFAFSDSIHTFDITCKRGDTFSAAFTFTGRVYTNYSFRCEVRDIITRRLILQYTPILSGTNVITLNKSASQLAVPAGTYNYDIALIDPDGDVDIDIVKGRFTITDDVSNNTANVLLDENGDPILVSVPINI